MFCLRIALPFAVPPPVLHRDGRDVGGGAAGPGGGAQGPAAAAAGGGQAGALHGDRRPPAGAGQPLRRRPRRVPLGLRRAPGLPVMRDMCDVMTGPIFG